jgi:glutaredoxin
MRILLAVALCAFALGAGAQVYRWTDDQGRVHVSDVPPPASAKDVKKIDVRTSPAPAAAAESKSSQQEPYALQRAQSKYPVTLYTIPNCEGCNAARTLLNARGVPFKEVSLTEAGQMDEFKKAVGGNTVPAMIVGSTVQKGFEEGAYQSLLDAAGYPVTGVLPPRDQQPTAAGAPNLPEVKPAAAAEPEQPSGPYAPGAAPPPPPTKKKK